MTSNVRDLLSSVCRQLTAVYGRSTDDWIDPDKMSDLIASFHQLLALARRDRPLLLILDSIDQLMPIYDAFKVAWLPARLPPFVKLVVSTLDEGYNILDNLRAKYDMAKGATFLEVKALGEDLGLEVIRKWLEKAGRTITDQQNGTVRTALEACSLPLYARIVFDQIRKWHSYDSPPPGALQPTVQGAICRLYEEMEVKFGRAMVRHSLSYLTAARHGLSEVELEHILSLDDVLLNEVFSHWNPPVRRIPPLLWTRIRADVAGYIVERSADDQLVLRWYHRQFSMAARERYLRPDADFALRIHRTSADYFSGRWGGGREKPFRFADAQLKRFGLTEAAGKADRKVPLQPYRITASGSKIVRINQRKLSELPWHLLASDQRPALKRDVFFNYNWLYSKLKSSGGQGLIREMEFFTASDRDLDKDAEIRILVANLQLIRPYVDRYPESLALELTGRVAHHIGQYSSFSELVRSCDQIAPDHCCLNPLLTCFDAADLGLKQNIGVRTSEPWHEGGVVVCNRAMTTMYLIDYDDQDEPVLSTWDLGSGGDKVTEVKLQRGRQTDDAANSAAAVDVYVEARLLGEDESHLLALYIPKYYGLHRERVGAEGFADVIRLSDGTVVRSMREYLCGQPFHNCILYMTRNWIALRYGWGVPLFCLWDERKIGRTKPHILTADEQKFVVVCNKRAMVKSYQGQVSVA